MCVCYVKGRYRATVDVCVGFVIERERGTEWLGVYVGYVKGR